MSITCKNGRFYKDGKPWFLISGEIHYFRLDPAVWPKHLAILKESGANTVSTYIPWDWHEISEGKYDFDGSTHPARNLLRFIALCRENGLDMIVKPGPYILAEYENQGLPGWLLKKLGKPALAVDETGKLISPDVFTYLSDEFLKYAFRWYDAVLPIVRANQQSCGGPIGMMQVCNEVGIFQWLNGKADYNDAVACYYREFVSGKYKTVSDLNRRYGTNFKDFSEVCPPAGEIVDRRDFAAWHDFHLFYRHYFLLYFNELIRKIRSCGVDVQLTHNIPGWIYGSASEMPMLMTTYSEVMRENPEIAFGLDHIPEFTSFRNAHSDLACNKILSALQKDAPVWAAEFQAGTREHHVRVYADEQKTFYFASLAHGLRGFNYYMFSQGVNPQGKGYFGRTFYFQTALDSAGNKLPLYDVIREVNRFISDNMEPLLESRAETSICIGLYKPYFYTDLVSTQMMRHGRLDANRLGLTFDPRILREDVLFNGAMRALQTLNFNYDVSDLEVAGVDGLLAYKQLWVVSAEYMDARTQRLLADYVLRGGHLVVYPNIPSLDEYLDPCTVLADALGIRFLKSASAPKVTAFGIDEVYTLTEIKQMYDVNGCEAIAQTKNGEPCGIRKECGEGIVSALGFAFGYSSDEHLRLYEAIAASGGIRRDVEASDPEIQFIVRKAEICSYLFLINYHNETKKLTVSGDEYEVGPYTCKVVIQD